MMRSLFALALMSVVACGGDPADPHAAATCSGWVDNQGNAFTGTCEAACAMPPANTGTACDTAGGLNCPAFTFDEEINGCCIQNNGTIRFYECE